MIQYTPSDAEPRYVLHEYERLRLAAHEVLREGWDPWELPMVLYSLRLKLGASRDELDAVLAGISDER